MADVRGLRRPLCLVGRRPRRVLAEHLGLLRGALAQPALRCARRRHDAWRRVVPRRHAQLRRARRGRLARRGGHRAHRAVADPWAARDHARRARRPGGPRPRRAEAPRRHEGRPGRRLPAEHRRDCRRLPRHAQPRRDLGQLRAGVRAQGDRRPLRPDRADGAARRPRLRLRRQGHRPPRRGRRDPRRPADGRARRRCALRSGRDPRRRLVGRAARRTRRPGVRGRSLRPPAWSCCSPRAPPASRRRSCTATAACCSSSSRARA